MADLTWDCTCGHSNPSAAPTCAACGRVPSLAPASSGSDSQGMPIRSRKPLPFSAGARRPAAPGSPEADGEAVSAAGVLSAPDDLVRPAMPSLRPDRGLKPADIAAAPVTSTPTAGAAQPEAIAAPEAPATDDAPGVEPPKKRPSFFDPEPDPKDVAARAAAERPKWWTTSAGRAIIVGFIVALAVLTYVILNTGNTKAPDQTPAGSSAPLRSAKVPAAARQQVQAVVAIPPVQDANSAA